MSAKFNPSDPVWFGNGAIGRNSLAKMLSQMCKKARLSTIYTSHCIRATSATVIKAAGVDNNRVKSVTGHKSDRAIESYSTRPTFEQQVQTSAIFSAFVDDQPTALSYQRLNPCLPRLQELPYFQFNQGNHCRQQKSREKRQWPPCKFALSRQATTQRQLRTRGNFITALSPLTASNVGF